MKYITLDNLNETIRKNIWKIPHDIDFIIGIPRSGMIGASIVSCLMNIPLIDINGFLNNIKPYGGSRLTAANQNKKTNKVLIFDDTVWKGSSMNKVKDQLNNYKEYEFIYGCVYLEGPAIDVIDIYLEDIRHYSNEEFTLPILHEWNIFQHYYGLMGRFLCDIDGVLCVNPPDDRNTEEYENYLQNAIPLFTPKTTLGGLITYRISKYREITQQWLKENNISYNELFMFDAESIPERNKVSSAVYKGSFYKNSNNYILMIESSDYEAQIIAQISGKSVFCVESNKMYNG